jgi:alkaline phosphatase
MSHYKSSTRIVLILLSLQLCFVSAAQLKRYTTQNAHSHNDYLNKAPFYLAYKNGFGSVEADIFSVDGILYVAHTKKEIKTKNTLRDLYVDPLARKFDSSGKQKLRLLIDIKENYRIALPLLIKELDALKPYLSTTTATNYLTIIISGNRPPPTEFKNYPDFIFFDADPGTAHTAQEWKRIGLVSLPFTRISSWKGNEVLKHKDRKALKHIIDSVHTTGKQIRFWAAPDTPASWKWQMKLRADLIGTDKVDELAAFLRQRN